MDQVQRVSVRISGQLTTPCSYMNDISILKKNLPKERKIEDKEKVITAKFASLLPWKDSPF